MIQEAIGKLVEGRHLGADEAEAVMDLIMAGEATQAQIGAYLVALRMAGELDRKRAWAVQQSGLRRK